MVLLHSYLWQLGSTLSVSRLEGDDLKGWFLRFLHKENILEIIVCDSMVSNYNKMRGVSETTLDGRQRSMIANLYTAWEQYSIPAIHYHYILAILAKKSKQDQIKIMSR